jgi:hypothetical protein
MLSWGLAVNAVLWLGLLLAAAGILIFLDSGFRFGEPPRWIFLLLWILLAVTGTRRILLPSFSMPDVRGAMLRLERKYPELGGRLVTAVELADEGARSRSGASTDLYRRVASAAEEMVGGLDPKAAVPSRSYVRRGILGAAVLVGIILGSWPMGGDITIGIQRLFTPWTGAEWPFRTQIVLSEEGPFYVRRGGTFSLAGATYGEVPSSGTILVWTGGMNGTPYRARFPVRKGGEFDVRYQPVTADLRTRLAIGDAESEVLEVRMVPPPEVESLVLSLEYPSYSRLPAVSVPDGNVQALFGTKAELRVQASKPLKKAYLSWHDGTGRPIELDGTNTGTATFEVRRNAAYRIDLVDEMGFESDPSVTYRVEMVDNEYPRIESMEPRGNKEVTPKAEVPLKAEVSDDFALAGVALFYRIGDAATAEVSLPLSAGLKRAMIDYAWKLADLGVEPGSSIEYWIEVRDEGEHFAQQPFPTTRPLHLRVVDAATLRRRLNERSQQLLSRLVELAQLQSENAEAVSAAAEEMNEDSEFDGYVGSIRTEEWKQERIRRQTASIGELLSELATDFGISKVGRGSDVRRIREAGKTLQFLASEPMPQVVLRLRHSVDLLQDIVLEQRTTE